MPTTLATACWLSTSATGMSATLAARVSGVQQLFASTVIQFDDSLIITKGKHIFHTGFQFMRDRINIYYASNSGNLGNLGFNGQYSGAGESDFFLGLPYTFGRGGSDTGTWGQRSSVFAGYVNDDFRVTDTLTVNLGLRYENHTPWTEVKNRQANFGLYTGQLYLAGQSCPYSNCEALYNSYNLGLDFQPRIGFAWSPKFMGGKTVFRGAYTISSFLEGTGTNLRLPINPPIRQAEASVIYPATQVRPPTTTDQGLILPPPGDPFFNATLRVWEPDLQPAAVQQWSFTIQHQFSNSMTLQASYVGQHGTHLMEPLSLNQKRLNADGSISPSPFLASNPSPGVSEAAQIKGTGFGGQPALRRAADGPAEAAQQRAARAGRLHLFEMHDRQRRLLRQLGIHAGRRRALLTGRICTIRSPNGDRASSMNRIT